MSVPNDNRPTEGYGLSYSPRLTAFRRIDTVAADLAEWACARRGSVLLPDTPHTIRYHPLSDYTTNFKTDPARHRFTGPALGDAHIELLLSEIKLHGETYLEGARDADKALFVGPLTIEYRDLGMGKGREGLIVAELTVGPRDAPWVVLEGAG